MSTQEAIVKVVEIIVGGLVATALFMIMAEVKFPWEK